VDRRIQSRICGNAAACRQPHRCQKLHPEQHTITPAKVVSMAKTWLTRAWWQTRQGGVGQTRESRLKYESESSESEKKWHSFPFGQLERRSCGQCAAAESQERTSYRTVIHRPDDTHVQCLRMNWILLTLAALPYEQHLRCETKEKSPK
jgi:hypothetical protein